MDWYVREAACLPISWGACPTETVRKCSRYLRERRAACTMRRTFLHHASAFLTRPSETIGRPFAADLVFSTTNPRATSYFLCSIHPHSLRWRPFRMAICQILPVVQRRPLALSRTLTPSTPI